MADQSGAMEVKRFDELRQVVSVGVHVIAIPGLARPAMAATIMGDAAAVVGRQEHHLAFPGIGAERPAVAENDGFSCAPVLVIDLRTIFRVECAHCLPPLVHDTPQYFPTTFLTWPIFS